MATQPLDGITAMAVILIISFAIERFVAGTIFLLSLTGPWKYRFSDPLRNDYKLIKFLLAGFAGVVVLALFGKLRILQAVGIQTSVWLDTLVTGIVLLGGADRLAGVLKLPGERGDAKPAAVPVQINASLVVTDGHALPKPLLAVQGEMRQS